MRDRKDSTHASRRAFLAGTAGVVGLSTLADAEDAPKSSAAQLVAADLVRPQPRDTRPRLRM